MTKQAKANTLNYLIDPIFSRVNELFPLSLEKEENRASFLKHYTPSPK